jgi:hypothetical protein
VPDTLKRSAPNLFPRPLSLKTENAKLKERVAQSEQTIEELSDFRAQALARLAAQHEEITRLRQLDDQAGTVRRLPARTAVIGSCS